MKKKKTLGVAGLGSAIVLMTGTAAFAAPGAVTGPSSWQSPYLVRTQPGVVTTSILTTGDTVGGYTLAGIPDGLGAFDNGDGTFTLLVNHEIPNTLGVTRSHGAKGAFVSTWVVDSSTLEVLSGHDLMQRVYDWKGGAWTSVTTAFSRFCSGDLAPVSAFYDAASGKGTQERIYLNGEETGAEGRAVAHVVTGSDAGSSYVLPWLGKLSWENAVAKPAYGEKTVVVGTDDSTPGQVYVYIGTKQSTGNDVERAGLTNGKVYGVKVKDLPLETGTTLTQGTEIPFTLVDIEAGIADNTDFPVKKVVDMTGAQLQAASKALGVSEMARPEDSSWDPSDPASLYVAMTNAFKPSGSAAATTTNSSTRLWHYEFADATDVTKGGVARLALLGPAYDASKSDAQQAGPRMLDNITVNSRGQVIALEDVGNNDYLGGVYQIDPSTGAFARIAQHDPQRFVPGASGFLTRDEESSGVIPAPFLGEGKYLVDVQAHYDTKDATTVEGGQLVVLQLPPGRPIR